MSEDSDAADDRPTTLYELLGVPREADEADIQDAFRELALDHHPDVNGGGAGDRMKLINHARETLLDEEKRAAYDAKLEELEIPPWHGGSDAETVQQAVAPREDEMSYMVAEDWVRGEGGPGSGPFEDTVTNLALRSWGLRTLLVLSVVLSVGWLNGAGAASGSDAPGLSALSVGVAGAFVTDALRTRLRVPPLDQDGMQVEASHLTLPVATAVVGAGLWTWAGHSGGAPGAFGVALLSPLAVVGGAVAVVSRVGGMNGTYAVVHGLLWGVAVALPFAGEQPAFIHPAVLPLPSSGALFLSTVIGGLALFCVLIGWTVGGGRLSRWAWELRLRGGRGVIPQAWELALAAPPLLGGLFLLSTADPAQAVAARYGMVFPTVKVRAATLGLLLVWTVPAVWCGLMIRERLVDAMQDWA